MGNLAVVFGTRPEAIKLGPVVAELRALGVNPTLMCTSQHTDLLKGTPAESDLKGALDLGLPSTDGKIGRWLLRAIPALERAFRQAGVDVVVVQGDTMSVLAAAWAAYRAGIPVAHVEAGLRSHSSTEPYPEERIRVGVSKIAAWHFAPSETARANLLAEGVDSSRIYVTGNPVVSALARYWPNEAADPPDRAIVITMHRREWTYRGAAHVEATFRAVLDMALAHPDVDFEWVLHPGVQKIVDPKPWTRPDNFLVLKPMGYVWFLDEIGNCMGIATDSGGLQEEAATLGVPCAVLRNVTDRPESVQAGVAKLFPPTPDGMTQALNMLLTRTIPRTPVSVYGTPAAAHNIAELLVNLTDSGNIR